MKVITLPADLLTKAGYPKLAKVLREKLRELVVPKWARTVWKAADGRQLRICDMETGHLLNSIRFQIRKKERGGYFSKKFEILKREAARRGFRVPPDGAVPKWLDRQNKSFGGKNKAEWIAAKNRRLDDVLDRMFPHHSNF